MDEIERPTFQTRSCPDGHERGAYLQARMPLRHLSRSCCIRVLDPTSPAAPLPPPPLRDPRASSPPRSTSPAPVSLAAAAPGRGPRGSANSFAAPPCPPVTPADCRRLAAQWPSSPASSPVSAWPAAPWPASPGSGYRTPRSALTQSGGAGPGSPPAAFACPLGRRITSLVGAGRSGTEDPGPGLAGWGRAAGDFSGRVS